MINSKGCEKKWTWPNIRYCTGICLEEYVKTRETSHDFQCHARDSSQHLPNTNQNRYCLSQLVQYGDCMDSTSLLIYVFMAAFPLPYSINQKRIKSV
jgi:hypothetical protein